MHGFNPRMRVRRSHDHCIRLIVKKGIVDELPVAAQQPWILETLNALTNSEFLHDEANSLCCDFWVMRV